MKTKIFKKNKIYLFFYKKIFNSRCCKRSRLPKLGLSFSDELNTAKIAQILKAGEIAAIPTETVYGLAANALSGDAVKKIFKAKGRQADNPLIVHISSLDQVFPLVKDFPDLAYRLAEKFWPGPLSMIFNKAEVIPKEVTAGLETVALRLPRNRLARAVIAKTGVPLAAPSANLSGRPSPTSAAHVFRDFSGKISAILDGGDCEIGLESTVISLTAKSPCLLRPGGVSKEEIESLIGKIDVHRGILNEVKPNFKVFSPGMKYKHYAPKAEVYLVIGPKNDYINYVNSVFEKSSESSEIGALCHEEDKKNLEAFSLSYGREEDLNSQARELFFALRRFNDYPFIKKIYARSPNPVGMGMAIYNRLIRAAKFRLINLGQFEQ
jgi:L-threonylcarbamoyladenylate synthase